MHRTFAVATLASLLLGGVAQSQSAAAQTVAALVGDDTLAMVDVGAGKVTKTMKIAGVTKILGIDVRPADGMLYALTADGSVYTIDAMGKPMLKSKLEKM